MNKYLVYLVVLSMFFISCEKKGVLESSSVLTVEVELLMDGEPMVYYEKYSNALGQTYELHDFRFYMSNIKLKDVDGDLSFEEENSYHLVTLPQNNHVFTFDIEGIKGEIFNQLEFSVGVDSDKNYSIDNMGALDPARGMAWDWNTGYKFVLMEGLYFPENDVKRGLVYHIGGDKNYRTVFLPVVIDFTKNSSATLKLKVEVGKIFGDKSESALSEETRKTNFITFERNSPEDTMFGAYTHLIADNYVQFFEVYVE